MSYATRTDSLDCDLSVFISKLSGCKQIEFSTAILSDFDNFKYFCTTGMVLASLYAFELSSFKKCCNALSYSTSMSYSSPIFITSPFCLLEIDATCQVLQWFMFYQFPWNHSALYHVILSVAAYSNWFIYSGFLVLGFFTISSFKLYAWSFYYSWSSFASSASFSAYFKFYFNFYAWTLNVLIWTEIILMA